MNRDEKRHQTKQKIIDNALLEFSEKSYNEASLNTICATGNISKGIIYHYFKDKDELYLYCLQLCFEALTEYLSHINIDSSSVEEDLENYFHARLAFFNSNPLYLKIFCNLLMNPPVHLKNEIANIKSDFDNLNIKALTKIIETVTLQDGVTVAEVVEIFREYQDFMNARFQMQNFEERTFEEHELRCIRSLKVLLYGVIKRKD